MDHLPTISVVMATHNRASLLPETIDSLLSQTVQDFEILIVDDASTDGTPALLQKLEQTDARIRTYSSGKNIGPGAARNIAIDHAKGKYIAIMDDDDICLPHRLEMQMKVLEGKPEISLTFSPVSWFSGNREVFQVFPSEVARGEFPVLPADVFELLYLRGNRIPNVTLFGHKRMWEELPYPVTPWIGEDWFWLMMHAAKGERFVATTEPLVLQRRDRANASLMQRGAQAILARRQVMGEVRRRIRELGITQFDHLHRKATARRMTHEARCWRGLKGLSWSAVAVAIDPKCQEARDTMTELLRAGMFCWRKPVAR